MQECRRIESPYARGALIDVVRSRGHFPVVIIGAGINGLGTFHDLSLQGVDCLIVDRGDFCSGTSATPSRMIHGGLKYFETGEFGLVAESVRERNLLLHNAPHVVRPLEMVIPIETNFGGELTSVLRLLGGNARLKRRGRLIVKVGLAAYDHLSCRNRVLPAHRMISGRDLHASFPGISQKFRYAASYFDGQIMMPERLGLELALDGMSSNPGSVALNHISLVARDDRLLSLEDRETGQRIAIGADVVVNAAGPWIDAANLSMRVGTSLISGNKGSHIVLDLPRLQDALYGRMIYFDPGDGRICLVTSLFGRVLLGSTDIPVGDAENAVCSDDEINYLFEALRSVFPSLNVSREHIVFTYSGVRPLPANDATDPGAVSRDHSIDVREPDKGRPFPILSLVGGKWTTYRALAAEAADIVLTRLGKSRRQPTERVAIGGGARLSPRVEDWERLTDEVTKATADRARAKVLVNRYGSRAQEVAAALGKHDQILRTLPDISCGEIGFMTRREMAHNLADIALRRLPLALSGQLTTNVIDELADHLARTLGWSAERRIEEIAMLQDLLTTKHRIDVKTRKFV